MRPSTPRTGFLLLTGLCVLAISPARAPADLMVTDTSYGFGSDHSTSYTVDIKYLYNDVIAGPFTTHFASDPTHSFLTFCVDLQHAVAAGDINSVVTTGSIGTIG